jgi:protein FrlC
MQNDALSNRFAGMNIHYFRHDFSRFLRDLTALELTRIELWGGMPHLSPDDVDSAEIAAIRRQIADHGLSLICFTPEQCLYPINLASEHVRTRERSLAYFQRSLDIAAELGAPELLVTAGWSYADADPQDGWNRARDALGELAQRAETLGVGLLLEPLSRTESNLITTADDLVRMRQELASPIVGAILDLNAMAAAGDTPEGYLARFGRDLRHVHLCDGTPEGHLAWGDGNLPMGDYLNALLDGGYAGSLTFELVTQAYWLDPRSALERSVTAARTVVGARS